VNHNISRRGKLQIFLGYANGVGKTYAMLEAARQRKAEGVDVIVAWVNAHDQPDSEKLLNEFEFTPHRNFQMGDFLFEEMDLGAVISRQPQLALVDDLAHTNINQSPHPRRYQDVEDLLDNGIDVYTTLNIYNLESLRDLIRQITGFSVEETIPDSIFDQAGIIELIDIPPEDLLHRYREGQIFLPDSLEPLAESFFRLGNLIALRELSMRRAAGRVESQMYAYMSDRAIQGPWPVTERLAVCISEGSAGERLVRSAQRLAQMLNAEWFALYVDIPQQYRISAKDETQALQTLDLAGEIGGKPVRISGRSVPEAVIDFAHRNNVTKLIVGRKQHKGLSRIWQSSIADKIIRSSENIDVVVINHEQTHGRAHILQNWWPHGLGIRYIYSLLLVAAVTIIGFPLQKYIFPTNQAMFYLFAVIINAIYLGRGPSMLASFIGAIAFDFFFTTPYFSLDVSDTQYLITFLGLLAVGLVVSYLAGLVRNQVETSKQRESQTATLYSLSRELTVLVELPEILHTVVHQIAQIFSRESMIFLTREGKLEMQAANIEIPLDDIETAAMNWSYEHKQSAGRGTNTYPKAHLRYEPLKTPRGMIGILGVKPINPNLFLSIEQRQFLDAYASLAALAIERAQLAEEASRVQIMSVTEKLQNSLLNSISHDLRTPLATITGVLSSLLEFNKAPNFPGKLAPADQVDLIEAGWEESQRLNRLVENLLDMTRLESGTLTLHRQGTDIQDLIGASLAQISDQLRDREVNVNIPEDLPSVSIDFVLVQQVLINLLDNAVKYSPPSSPIDLQADLEEDHVEIKISDRGLGIPGEDLGRVFDKFYRVQRNDSVSGTGLGLAICKGIVEVHGGRIFAELREGSGTTMHIWLPIEGKSA
jgi:two-component system sensor histidine kinase KdpD